MGTIMYTKTGLFGLKFIKEFKIQIQNLHKILNKIDPKNIYFSDLKNIHYLEKSTICNKKTKKKISEMLLSKCF